MTTAISRFTRTATLSRTSSSGLDEYGNPALVEADEVVSCHVRPLSSDERGEGVEKERMKLYLPPDESLEASDVVTIDGERFEVVSVPVLNTNPRSQMVESVTCLMERTG